MVYVCDVIVLNKSGWLKVKGNARLNRAGRKQAVLLCKGNDKTALGQQCYQTQFSSPVSRDTSIGKLGRISTVNSHGHQNHYLFITYTKEGKYAKEICVIYA